MVCCRVNLTKIKVNKNKITISYTVPGGCESRQINARKDGLDFLNSAYPKLLDLLLEAKRNSWSISICEKSGSFSVVVDFS